MPISRRKRGLSCSFFNSDYGNFYYDDKVICNAIGIQARHSKPKTKEVVNLNKARIYPNPAYNFLTIETPSEYTAVSVSITNSLGQNVETFKMAGGTHLLPITLSAGTYYVSILAEDACLLNTKLVVIK